MQILFPEMRLWNISEEAVESREHEPRELIELD